MFFVANYKYFQYVYYAALSGMNLMQKHLKSRCDWWILELSIVDTQSQINTNLLSKINKRNEPVL